MGARIHHTALTVDDLERTTEFYRDVLGLAVVDRFTVSGRAFSRAVDVDGATGKFVHLDGNGARVELVEYEPTDNASTGAALNQPGVGHVGFTVEDVDSFYAALPEDAETLSEPVTTQSGARILFLRDPEGNLIEILDP